MYHESYKVQAVFFFQFFDVAYNTPKYTKALCNGVIT
jgi:hypothetical protein